MQEDGNPAALRRWRVAVAGLAVVAALVGCVSSGHTSPDSAPATDSTATAPADTRQVPPTTDLAPELLVVQDLPPGWSKFQATGAGPSSRGCLSELTSASGRVSRNSRSEAQFRGGIQQSEFIQEILESFSPGGALGELVRYRQVLAACTRVTVAASGLSFTGTISAIALPTLGDDSTGYRMQLNSTVGTVPVSLFYRLVVARRRDTVLVLVVSSFDPATIDQLQRQTAVTAMAKVG